MKKKSFHLPVYKQWWFPYVSAGIILPSVGLIWAQINNVWSAPQEIKSVKEAIIQNSQTQATLTQMVQDQAKKNDQQDAQIEQAKVVSQLQIDSLRELMVQLKKGK